AGSRMAEWRPAPGAPIFHQTSCANIDLETLRLTRRSEGSMPNHWRGEAAHKAVLYIPLKGLKRAIGSTEIEIDPTEITKAWKAFRQTSGLARSSTQQSCRIAQPYRISRRRALQKIGGFCIAAQGCIDGRESLPGHIQRLILEQRDCLVGLSFRPQP